MRRKVLEYLKDELEDIKPKIKISEIENELYEILWDCDKYLAVDLVNIADVIRTNRE